MVCRFIKKKCTYMYIFMGFFPLGNWFWCVSGCGSSYGQRKKPFFGLLFHCALVFFCVRPFCFVNFLIRDFLLFPNPNLMNIFGNMALFFEVFYHFFCFLCCRLTSWAFFFGI